MNQTNNQFPVRVMMEQTVIEAINNMAFRNPNLEDGGILLGNIATDPVTGHPVIVVSELYYESHPEHQKSSTYTFSPDYKLRALTHCTDFYSRHHSDRRPVGNVHSHARHPAFLSGVDKQMMASSPGEQVYLVISPSHYNCVAVYVDDQHNLHECTIAVIGGDEFKVGRTVQTDHPSYRQAGNSFPAVSLPCLPQL